MYEHTWAVYCCVSQNLYIYLYNVFSSCATSRVTRLLETKKKNIINQSLCVQFVMMNFFPLAQITYDSLHTLSLSLSSSTKQSSCSIQGLFLNICMFFLYIFIEYGRSCKDIGCLPRETCVMSYDTCSFNQQEGTNCGRYPTCQKRTDLQTPQQNTNTGKYIGKKRILND